MTEICLTADCWRPVHMFGRCKTCLDSETDILMKEADDVLRNIVNDPTSDSNSHPEEHCPYLGTAPDPWMPTLSSKELDFLNPRPEDITIEDIAISLARTARFNGHTVGRVDQIYTVAQHSCHVHDYIMQDHPRVRELRLYALLHDATEAYLPDVHTQLKDHLQGFRKLEHGIEAAIAERYGLSSRPKDVVKAVDRRMLATERRDLMPFSERSWGSLDDVEPYRTRLIIWSVRDAYREFLWRYGECVRLEP